MKITLDDDELNCILNDYFRKQYNGNFIEFDFVHNSNDDESSNETNQMSDEENLMIWRARCVEKIKVELKGKRKINALRIFREFTKRSLAEAKDFVERPDVWDHYIITGRL